MKQILKVCIVLVLGTGILSSSPLTGDWQIDKQYTYKNNKAKYKDILGMTMSMLSELKISDNDVIAAVKVGLKAKLEKRGKHYALVSDERELPLYLLDANHIKLIQTAPDNSKYAMYYSRTKLKHKDATKFTSSQAGFKLNRVYRSKKIDDEYRFILFTGNGKLYYVQTDRTKYLTSNEMRSKNIMKLLRQKSSSGSSFAEEERYTLRDGKVYTLLGKQKLGVINSEKLKYDGAIYALQK